MQITYIETFYNLAKSGYDVRSDAVKFPRQLQLLMIRVI